MELGTEDYFQFEHQFEDEDRGALLAGGTSSFENAMLGTGGGQDEPPLGRLAQAAHKKALRNRHKKAAPMTQVLSSKQIIEQLNTGSPVSAAALRRRQMMRIGDLTRPYIVRCRLAAMDDDSDEDRPHSLHGGAPAPPKKRDDALPQSSEDDSKALDGIEEKITVEHLRQLAQLFREPSATVEELLSAELSQLATKARSPSHMDRVRGSGDSIWAMNANAVEFVRSKRLSQVAQLPMALRGDATRESRRDTGDSEVPHESQLKKSSRASTCVGTSSGVDDGALPTRRVGEDEFVAGMWRVLGHLVPRNELRLWFRHIDAESAGSVGWEDLTGFLLSRGEHRAHVDSRPLSLGIKLQPVTCHPWNRHEGPISAVVVNPKTGTVYTGGQDGMIVSWEASSLRNAGIIHNGHAWVVSLRLMRGNMRLAACTVTRELLIFDLKHNELSRLYKGRCVFQGEKGLSFAYASTALVHINERIPGYLTPREGRVTTNRADNREKAARLQVHKVGAHRMSKEEHDNIVRGAREERQLDRKQVEQLVLVGLVDAPTCMEYHFTILEQDMFFFGTRTGSVLLYNLPSAHEKLVRIYATLHVHKAAVNAMEVVPALEALLTCSDDCSLRLTSLESGATIREFSRQGHQMGVTGFAFSHKHKLFVSVSAERHALVWDYLQDAPVFTLEDHPAPLLSACINEVDGHIITLSSDNTVRFSDLTTHRTLQTVTHKHHLRSAAHEDCAEELVPTFSTMHFDAARHRHIICSHFPQMYLLKQAATSFPVDYVGHVSPVVLAAYNPSTKQIATFDAETCIAWDHASGGSQFSFPYSTSFSASADENRLTAVGWDASLRRLLCGFHNGIVVVWNYANGQPMNVLHDAHMDTASLYGVEVSAVASTMLGDTAMYLYAVGRRLYYTPETQQYTVTNVASWEVPHDMGAVTSLARANDFLIAIGTSSGGMCFFNLSLEVPEGRPLRITDYREVPQPRLASLVRDRLLDREHSTLSLSRRTNSTTSVRRSISSRSAYQVEMQKQATMQSSRVERVFAIQRAPLVLAAHNDGTLALWHTSKRSYLGSIAISGCGGAGVNCFDIDAETNETLACADTTGNIIVWTLRFDEVPFVECLRKYNKMATVYSAVDPSERVLTITESSFCRTRFHAHERQIVSVSVIPCNLGKRVRQKLALEDRDLTQRPSLSDASPLSHDETMSQSPELQRHSSSCSVSSQSASGRKRRTEYLREATIVTCSIDCLVKLFTLDGQCIGIFGMKRWSLHQRGSWQTTVPDSPQDSSLGQGESSSLAATRVNTEEALLQSLAGGNALPPSPGGPALARTTGLSPTQVLETTILAAQQAAAASPTAAEAEEEDDDADHFFVPLTCTPLDRSRQTVAYLAPSQRALTALLSAEGSASPPANPRGNTLLSPEARRREGIVKAASECERCIEYEHDGLDSSRAFTNDLCFSASPGERSLAPLTPLVPSQPRSQLSTERAKHIFVPTSPRLVPTFGEASASGDVSPSSAALAIEVTESTPATGTLVPHSPALQSSPSTTHLAIPRRPRPRRLASPARSAADPQDIAISVPSPAPSSIIPVTTASSSTVTAPLPRPPPLPGIAGMQPGDVLPTHLAANLRSQSIAIEHLRHQQGRLEQYGLSDHVRRIEQRVHASNATATLQARYNKKSDDSREDGAKRTAAETLEAVQRLSSQMLVVPLETIAPPVGSWAAQEEARRGGKQLFGARASVGTGPSFTAPGVPHTAR